MTDLPFSLYDFMVIRFAQGIDIVMKSQTKQNKLNTIDSGASTEKCIRTT